MPRPRRIGKWIDLHRGVYHVFWYDPEARQTRRLSLKTADVDLAKERYRERFGRVPRTVSRMQARPGKQTVLSVARKICRKAQSNAKAKGRPFEIDYRDIATQIEKQKNRCVLSGIEFSTSGEYRDPWAASLDRIDSSKGYVPGNVRVVCYAVNMAMNLWGESVLFELVRRIGQERERLFS